ncbi:hypothetical protein MPTK1_2g21410 [Marchantia polymorpha subsp. ruderalis]|uniref:Uncharacterized protein n=1 Tax=Marchantia polymorpha TaxID=3197 RepID=A0A2R6X2R5_MARPO|nr:hypothetical protein MARPO_0040s0073 [Marchantia polymorpha]PTQ40400.1 hypothetical protein MARPO_0040s0073 [Marchantia polymorpha]BBN03177.1 hypothetical protein Mp_2g21410 [Marchantia polymorpha subsp. ruderalis]BBN03178.1 hypothetical protein Mp_2g21410 [Marchantia polymorpha subsp. ruderalis]|eukprot:PTQ40399.1 hypothetical protein MARPO_0040s0073 [Marchantia polymorpha]
MVVVVSYIHVCKTCMSRTQIKIKEDVGRPRQEGVGRKKMRLCGFRSTWP